MLLWDVTPIWECIAEVKDEANKIDAAINWDELSTDEKNHLKEAMQRLFASISLAELHAGKERLVGQYVDIKGEINRLHLSLDSFLNVVELSLSPKNDHDPMLSAILHNRRRR